jgi:hypothetical protein
MVLLAAPSVVPLPPVVEEIPSPWQACQHTWQAWDGTEWDLSHGLSGLALQAGVRGMRPPPLIRYVTKMPAVAGSIYRGSVADEREIFWPIKVFNDAGSTAWIAHNKRFWHTLDEDNPGVWVVTQPDGTRRYLTCRYTGLEDDSDDIDPGLVGWCVYGIKMAAEQPYWAGETVTETFLQVPPTNNYYGGATGFAPPYVTVQGSAVTTACITNSGDVTVWPTWTINGPCTTATVGIGTRTITFPIVLTAGQWLKLNTDPTDQVVVDQAGVDRTAQITVLNGGFAPIPKGVDVALQVSLVGSGSVQVAITPKYKSALS